MEESDNNRGACRSWWRNCAVATDSDILAIDMLWPCHWDYVRNLETVLGVIGGDPKPRRPFAFCARNIKLSPVRERMKTVSHTLQVFCQDRPPDDDVDSEQLASLGEPSRQGQWLAASLDKTIRLQMDL